MSIYRARVTPFSTSTAKIHQPASRSSESSSPRLRVSNSILSGQRIPPQISSPRAHAKHTNYIKDLPLASPRLPSKEPSFRQIQTKSPSNSKNLQNEIMAQIIYCTSKPVPESAQDMDEKNQKLSQIHQFLNRYASQLSSVNSMLHDIFLMLGTNLFRTIHSLSPFLLYSDSKVYVTQPLWPHICLVHNILAVLLKSISSKDLHQYVNHSFLSRFIELLSTPDLTERASLEAILALIFEKFPQQRAFIFRHTLIHITDFLEDMRTYTCVVPCLHYIHNYLRIVMQPKTEVEQLSKSIIAALFIKNYSAEYFEDLQSLNLFICEGDQQLTIWFIQYLVMHFPMTDSTKQCYFLQHFLNLIKLLPYNSAATIASPVFSLIADGIKSLNFRVSLCAMEIIQNPSFMRQFAPYAGAVTRTIAPCLQLVRNHWCDMVRDAGHESMRAMKEFDKSIDRVCAKGDGKIARKNRESYNNWAQMLHNSNAVIEAEEKVKITHNLSQFASQIGIR